MKRLLVLLIAVAVLFGLSTNGLLAQKKSQNKAFAKMDTNNDGKISFDEYKAAMKQGKNAAKAEKRFSKLDKDNDTLITLEEFKNAATKRKPAK
jgi:Ca2+-binding EF-hand superfamily protein